MRQLDLRQGLRQGSPSAAWKKEIESVCPGPQEDRTSCLLLKSPTSSTIRNFVASPSRKLGDSDVLWEAFREPSLLSALASLSPAAEDRPEVKAAVPTPSAAFQPLNPTPPVR